MFGNVAHKADCSGGLSNPLCRNSLCFSQSRHTAPIQMAKRLLPGAQKHSCMPLCVPLLSIHHLTACTCPPSHDVISVWPLAPHSPQYFIRTSVTPICHSQTWAGVCVHERPLFSIIKYVFLVLDADWSVLTVWNCIRVFKLFDDKDP